MYLSWGDIRLRCLTFSVSRAKEGRHTTLKALDLILTHIFTFGKKKHCNCIAISGKSVISAAGVSGGFVYFEFDGKAYLLSNSTDKGDYDENVAACENVGYKLATLRYMEEFSWVNILKSLNWFDSINQFNRNRIGRIHT